MIIQTLQAWGWLIAIAVNLFIAWIGWSLKAQFMTRDDHARRMTEYETRWTQAMEKLTDVVHVFADRLTRAEEATQRRPSHDDLQRVHDRLDTVVEELREVGKTGARIDGAMGGINNLTRLLTEQLMERRA